MVLDHAWAQFATQGVPKRVHLASRGPGEIAIKERRFGQRHVETVDPALDQFFPMRRLDVVRLDLQEHLGVQIQRGRERQPFERLAETRIAVAATQVVMVSREVETPPETLLGRIVADRALVMRKRFAPSVLHFELPPLTEQLADFGRTRRDQARRLGRRGMTRSQNDQHHKPGREDG